jgi:hypothetical protein
VTAPAVVRHTREGYRGRTAGPSGARPVVVRRGAALARGAARASSVAARGLALGKARGLGWRAASRGGAGAERARATSWRGRRSALTVLY